MRRGAEQVCVRGAAWQHLALLATLREPRAWRTSFLPGAGHEAAPPAIGRTDRPRLAETPAPAPWDAGGGGGSRTEGAARAVPGVSRASGRAEPSRGHALLPTARAARADDQHVRG